MSALNSKLADEQIAGKFCLEQLVNVVFDA